MKLYSKLRYNFSDGVWYTVEESNMMDIILVIFLIIYI